jgi:hypothetical protein
MVAAGRFHETTGGRRPQAIVGYRRNQRRDRRACRDGLGVGGGVYNLGTFTFDVFTVIKKNHASTSYDDIFP